MTGFQDSGHFFFTSQTSYGPKYEQ